MSISLRRGLMSSGLSGVPFLTYNHTWVTADIQGNEYDGGGVGEGIKVASDDAFNLKGGDFSIEVKRIVISSEPDGVSVFAGKWGPETTQGWLFYYANSTNLLNFLYTTNGTTDISTVFGSSALSVGVTYDFALIRTGTDVKAYVDNVQVGSTLNVGTNVIMDNTENLTIGNYEVVSGVFLNGGLAGTIDQLKISNVAVSSTMDANLSNDENTVYLNTFNGANGSQPTLNTQ